MAGLTPRQRRFVEAYLEEADPTAAARRAGWSEKAAVRAGEAQLAHPAVAEALAEAEERRRKQRERRAETERERVLAELSGIAFAPGGDGRDSNLKFSNKLRALKLLLDVYTPPGERVADDEGEERDGVILLTPMMDPLRPPEEDEEDD